MKKAIICLTAACLWASPACAQDMPQALSSLRQETQRKTDKALYVSFSYKYDKDADYLTPAARAALRGAEAAKAWQAFDRSKPVALLARSPFGGGETAKSYWPAGIKPEFIQNLVEPLTKAGLKLELAEPLPTTRAASAPAPVFDLTLPGEAATKPKQPWPKTGFSEDYDFALLVGLHHEIIPYEGTRRNEEGKLVYNRSSRVNAWAILFYAPTGTAFWGTTATANINHAGVADPPNLAAETAISYLDFGDFGKDNIPGYIEQLAQTKELPAVDISAMLVQSQRADGMAAVLKAAQDNSAYKVTAWVLRYFNPGGTPQDFRLDADAAKAQNLTLASQRVMMHWLLLEQLRGMRAIQPCALASVVPQADDLDIFKIARQHAGLLEPVGPDEELVLIAELANWAPVQPTDPRNLLGNNILSAIRNLGKCKTHVELALALAKHFSERPLPPSPPGRPARRDPIKEAGKAALDELAKAKAAVPSPQPGDNSPDRPKPIPMPP